MIKTELKEFKVGDRVCGEDRTGKSYKGIIRFVNTNSVHVERDDKKPGGGNCYNNKNTWVCSYSCNSVMSDCSSGIPLSMENMCHGGKQMKLKSIKKTNMNEAKKQFDEDKANAEITFAKNELTRATNEIDRLDRDIESIEDRKKPYLEILATFKK